MLDALSQPPAAQAPALSPTIGADLVRLARLAAATHMASIAERQRTQSSVLSTQSSPGTPHPCPESRR